MLLYYITDRRTFPGSLGRRTVEALEAGVDMVQIREKDLEAADLLELARGVAPTGKILINGRVDVALAAHAAGAHLPSSAPAPSCYRGIVPEGFQFGVSCHCVDEARRAEQEGADFVVFGPVFDTPSKRGYGPPKGLDCLAKACRAVQLPVLALGGVAVANVSACLDVGAAGVAGISLFQGPEPVADVVQGLRAGEAP